MQGYHPSSCLEHAVGSGSRAPDRAGDPNRRQRLFQVDPRLVPMALRARIVVSLEIPGIGVSLEIPVSGLKFVFLS